MDKRARGKGSRRRSVWVAVAVVVALAAGAARLRSQELSAPERATLERPEFPEPRLLTRDEVERGLGERMAAMRQRHEAYRQRRRQQPPRDYRLPEPPPDAQVPPRPDAPDGEITLQRRGGAR